MNEQKSYEGHEIQSFWSAANGWAPRTYKSLYLSRAPAQDRFGNTQNIVSRMIQYPGIVAGNFLETVSGVSERFGGFLEAVAGHPHGAPRDNPGARARREGHRIGGALVWGSFGFKL